MNKLHLMNDIAWKLTCVTHAQHKLGQVQHLSRSLYCLVPNTILSKPEQSSFFCPQDRVLSCKPLFVLLFFFNSSCYESFNLIKLDMIPKL